ncbi:dorsal-related immunity factor Dif-like isoform X3 [Pieris rapae]|uniref:dorsal-related immunity factor Dif-like isoform X3 n=1 Tax=Pieris rapae TaxID=64459 RepID=UPI001E27FDE1|nr:dorsal-related immunity factor Dif-like isoform X3 [Pieris rapae]
MMEKLTTKQPTYLMTSNRSRPLLAHTSRQRWTTHCTSDNFLQDNMTSNNYEPRVEFLKKVHKRVFRFPYPDPINPEKNNNGKTIYGNSLRRTYPTIKIHCPFDTTAIVLVSCITDDVNGKHMPHPHRIVRHPDCKNGVCVVNGIIKNGEAVVVFRDIALLRTLKKDALEELQKRREFVKTIGAECNLFRGEHIEASMFNLHSVRICFQVLLKMGDRYMELKPLISEPLIDYLALSNLNILEMCPDEGRINWATKIVLVIKSIKKTNEISVIFVDEDSNEFPAVMEETQPFVFFNGCGVLICYTPKIFLEDSVGCSEFAVKVRSNDGETLSENMRGFVFRRIVYPDYSETEYLEMLKDKKFNSSLIAEIGERMSGPEYTETAAQDYNTPSTSYPTMSQMDEIDMLPSFNTQIGYRDSQLINDMDIVFDFLDER